MRGHSLSTRRNRLPHVSYHLADISLLGGIVGRPRVITRGRQCPAAFPGPQLLEKLRREINILMRVEHGLKGAEMTRMKMMIDLHAPDIDERRTAFPRFVEAAQRFTQIRSEKSGSLEV